MAVLLALPTGVFASIQHHLFHRADRGEAAAFVIARDVIRNGDLYLEYLDWHSVEDDGFAVRTGYHIELTDEARATVIKRVHDLDGCLVEFHSHLGTRSAELSPSDMLGLEEFVPHARWRLRDRPYLAVVMSRTDLDALAWVDTSDEPVRLDGIYVGRRLIRPTGLSSLEYDSDRPRPL